MDLPRDLEALGAVVDYQTLYRSLPIAGYGSNALFTGLRFYEARRDIYEKPSCSGETPRP